MRKIGLGLGVVKSIFVFGIRFEDMGFWDCLLDIICGWNGRLIDEGWLKRIFGFWYARNWESAGVF